MLRKQVDGGGGYRVNLEPPKYVHMVCMIL